MGSDTIEINLVVIAVAAIIIAVEVHTFITVDIGVMYNKWKFSDAFDIYCCCCCCYCWCEVWVESHFVSNKTPDEVEFGGWQENLKYDSVNQYI